MTERPYQEVATELERGLTELRPRVAYPPTPDIASSLQSRIAARPEGSRRTRPAGSFWQPRRLAIGFLILILASAGLLAAFPDLRTAVADRFGLGGIRIEFVDETPTPGASPVGATLLLGEQLTLEQAQARAPYAIHVPRDLGAPDEVFMRELTAGPMVSLLYRPRPGLPEAAETGVGAILMQFPADAHPADLSKRITMGMGSIVEVSVGDAEGYWITGHSQFVIVEDPSEDFEDILSRPSAHVLIWQANGVTYRLETDLVQRDAIQLGESMEPASGTDASP